MEKKLIEITCKGNRSLPLDDLKGFQGSLKSLSDDNREKLKRLIIKRGFSFPVFVWGSDNILDGHQRLDALHDLLSEGYELAGDIPVCYIEAKNEKEAAEKLLELQGNFGKLTETGLMAFIDTYEIDFMDLSKDIELPDIDMDEFIKGYIENIDSISMDDMGDDDPGDPADIVVRIQITPDKWIKSRNEVNEFLGMITKKYKAKASINE